MRKTAKRRGSVAPVLILLLSLTLAAMLILLLLKLKGKEPEPISTYVSMTDEAAARAYIWLNQIEDMPFSYTEIKRRMGDIRLEVVLTPTEEKGKYRQALAEDTFTDCNNQAQNGLETAYREVLRTRLQAAGYEGEIADDTLDDMMREAYGVSVSEYLAICEVQLLPAPEELLEMYSGEATYE